jgi:hypothetical protein
LQNVQGVPVVRAERLTKLALDLAPTAAHDFR